MKRLWIADGTLIAVRDRKGGASSRNYRFSANVQVIINADTRLVIAAARPVPGNTADAKAWRDSVLANISGAYGAQQLAGEKRRASPSDVTLAASAQQGIALEVRFPARPGAFGQGAQRCTEIQDLAVQGGNDDAFVQQ